MDFSGSKIGGAHKNYPFPNFDKCQQAHMILVQYNLPLSSHSKDQ